MLGNDGPGSVTTVQTTSVAYKDRLFLYSVIELSEGTTGIDCVFVVETSADGVTFNDLIAHRGNAKHLSGGSGCKWSKGKK